MTLERAGGRKGKLGSGEHSQRRQEQSQVVPGSTGYGTRRHYQENRILRTVEKMVEWQI